MENQESQINSNGISIVSTGDFKPYTSDEIMTLLGLTQHCEICDSAMPLPLHRYYHGEVKFSMCNECKSDLKEFVLSKRQTKKEQ